MFLSAVPRIFALLCMLGIITGCARQAYVPRAMELNAAVQEYSTRVLDAPALEQYLHAQGVAMEQWPLPRWDLGELTLAAFFHRSELHAARARGAAARAQVVLAAQRAPLIASPRVEHHSGEGASSSPWSLGFDIEIPLTSAARRSAAIERAEYLAQAAELELGARAWQVRSEVRAQLLELHAARLHGDSLEREVAAQQTVVDMLQRRLQEGYAGVSEVDAARLRLAQAKGDLLEATTQVERALGGLAQAVGVPPEALRAATLSFAAFETLPPAPDAAYVRRQGLTNRLDLRRSLLEFDAADATVKLEIARQYPDFSITPGYLWDQGDNMWSFALDLLLPATITHGPAIRAAMAQREAAAREALALQDRLLGEVEARCAVFAQARVAADAAQAATRMQLARSNQIQRQFDVGQADRVELTLAHIEALLVQRRAMAALIDAQRILGQLEDALQVPLSGGPLPAVPDAPVHAAGGA